MLRIASRGQIFSWDRPVVMGIMNVTPDSFFDGGKYQGLTSVLEHCKKMASEGADILDLGAFPPDRAVNASPTRKKLSESFLL